MYCRNCGNVLSQGSDTCPNCGVPKGDGANFCPNCHASIVLEMAFCAKCGCPLLGQNSSASYNQQTPPPNNNAYQQPASPYTGGSNQKSKIAAGVLGILLGSLGIHNFYLGFTSRGIAQILLTLVGGIVTCGITSTAAAIWGLVEGILILTGSINTDANGIPLRD